MLTYLARRILLMIPTLLGISFVTLLLIRLAPGDPVQAQVGGLQAGKGGLSPEEIEAMRRTYFLHLPLILPNLNPEDSDTVNQKLVDNLTSPDQDVRDRTIRQFVRRGGIGLPMAIEAIDGATPEATETLLMALEALAPRLLLEDDLKAAGEGDADQAAFWGEYLDANRSLYTPQGGRDAVSAWLASPTDETTLTLRRADTQALTPLADALKDAPRGGEDAKRIFESISIVTLADYTIQEGDDAAAIERVYESWKSFWYKTKADFVQFEGSSRVVAMFTETQYFKWVTRIFTLNFDRSSRDNLPIKDKLWEKLQPTLLLALLSLALSYIIAIPIGVFSAVKQYTFADQATTFFLFVLYSLPSFWVAMLLQRYLCGGEGLDIFPLAGLSSEGAENLAFVPWLLDRLWHLVLPVFCLTYASFASLSRYQRVGMLDTIRADFIRTARAKGLSERVVIFKHALRNSVIPIITLMGLQLPFLVSGAVIVEMIFQIQGMGLETLQAIRIRDLNWIMASVTLTAVMTMVGILFSDILYALIDPRIQVGSDKA